MSDKKRIAKRLNITISPDILKIVDEYCEKYGMTRSGFFAHAAKQKIEADTAIGMLPELMKYTTELLQGFSGDEALQALKSPELHKTIDDVSVAANQAAEAVGQTSFSNL